MYIFDIDSYSIPIVAGFMASIKPEFWDMEGAAGQLQSGIGWYFGESRKHPKGWILCRVLECYRALEIECLGCESNIGYKIGYELQPLIETAEAWAREKGLAVSRFTIGSRGLSCHLRELKASWEELRDIRAVDREEFDWFLSMGYEPSGIMPNIYGNKYHGIILIKSL